MKIFIEGTENEEFLDVFNTLDPDFNGVDDNWSPDMCLYFAMVYQGWLMALRKFDHKKYE